MLGYRHTMISLLCMSTHKAMVTRCLSYHQAASGQPAIWALAMVPLRRLALSMLFTIATTSYQTTLYSLREIFNKRQHTNATYRVEFSHYDNTHHQKSKQGYQLTHKKDWCPSKSLKKILRTPRFPHIFIGD